MAYNGPLGKLLGRNVWTLGVGPYEKIEVNNFPTVDDKILRKFSNDAKDLYRLCIAVTTGANNKNLVHFLSKNLVCSRTNTLGIFNFYHGSLYNRIGVPFNGMIEQ